MLSGSPYTLPCSSHYISCLSLSLLRPEEVIRTGTPGKGSISGAGSAATVSPSGGHTSCWGMCSVTFNPPPDVNIKQDVRLRERTSRTRARGWLKTRDDRIETKEDVKRCKNRNHQVEITWKCHRKVSYYGCDTFWNCLALWMTDSRTEWFDGCTLSQSAVSGWGMCWIKMYPHPFDKFC